MARKTGLIASAAPFHANLLLWFLSCPWRSVPLPPRTKRKRLRDSIRTRVVLWWGLNLKAANLDEQTMAVLEHYAEHEGSWVAACDILEEQNIDVWGDRSTLTHTLGWIERPILHQWVREHILWKGNPDAFEYFMVKALLFGIYDVSEHAWGYMHRCILPVP